MVLAKILRILIAIEFILIAAIIFLNLNDNQNIPTAFAVKENISEKTSFKTFTRAVCEEKSEHMICIDKLFIKCDEEEHLISNATNNFIECNNIKINFFDKVNGSVAFRKK